MAHTAGPGTSAAEEGIVWFNKLDAYAQQFNNEKPRLFDQVLLSIRDIHTSSDGLANQIEIKLGLRLPPDFDRSCFEKWLGQVSDEATIKTYAHEPAFYTKRVNPLSNQFNQAIRAAGGQTAYKLKTGTSDMNVVAPTWGCPIIAYGPGDSTLDHTPDEHIVIEEYLQAIDILQAVLTNLG